MAEIKNIEINNNNLVINYKGNHKPSTEFNLAPSGIFMDTAGHWTFNTSIGQVEYPALAYNARAIVNYFYLAKTLSENSSSKKKIPISFFQLNGGNLPIENDNNTYPMRYIPNISPGTFKNQTNYINNNSLNLKTSQFTTYLFGEKGLKSDLSNVDSSILSASIPNGYINDTGTTTTIQKYFTQYNNDTQIKATDFGLSSDYDIFSWSKNKTAILKACNIISINWGSNQSYTVAPYDILMIGSEYGNNSYGSSWILNEQIKQYYIENPNGIRMGGFMDIGFTPYINEDQIKYMNMKTLATYTTANNQSGEIDKFYTPYDTKISNLINALPNKVKPYFATYLINGSYQEEYFWESIQYIKYPIVNMISACLSIEDYGMSKKYDDNESWGDLCISPDFGVFARKLGTDDNSWWSDLLGNWITSTRPELKSYETDIHFKTIALEICEAFYTTNGCVYDIIHCGDSKCFVCPVNSKPCTSQHRSKCICNSCGDQWKPYMKGLYNYISSQNSDEIFGTDGIINITKNGIGSLNALVGFFLNACGPHVNAGWDIGWTFNKEGSGEWAHNSYKASDFNYNSDVLDKDGWVDGSNSRTKAGPADVALYYLKNCMYGNNETIIKNPPPIYKGH
jgi:hypothetical protein